VQRGRQLGRDTAICHLAATLGCERRRHERLFAAQRKGHGEEDQVDAQGCLHRFDSLRLHRRLDQPGKTVLGDRIWRPVITYRRLGSALGMAG